MEVNRGSRAHRRCWDLRGICRHLHRLTGYDTIRHTETALNVTIGFDVSNHRAVQHLRETRFRLISDITAEQRDSIQQIPGGRNCAGVLILASKP